MDGPADTCSAVSWHSAASVTTMENSPRQYLADFSLALINRTGAYFVARDLLLHLSRFFFATRYWRIIAQHEPCGLRRWLMGKSMIAELVYGRAGLGLRGVRPSAGVSLPTLFLDPLYVLRSSLKREDIVLCHDVGPISHPSLFAAANVRVYRQAYRIIAKAGPGMVFVSEASRRSFIALFGMNFRFLKVIPIYVRHDVELGNDVAPPFVRKPFLLTVGALETRKNYPRAIDAFRQSGLADRGYSYVFCGPRGNAGAAIKRLAAAAPSVQGIGYRSDAEVRWLYRNASGLVLPSLLEGFGLPALEAARHRLLSLVSADTAQEEVLGGGAVLADPLSVRSIAAGMRQLVEMTDAQREAKLALALKRVQEFTLETFIARWTELLESS